LHAVVTGVEPFGLFVQGLEIPAEGLVPLNALPDDVYRFDKASHTLSGRRPGQTFRLGDRVEVAVARVDLDRRELDFRLVTGPGRPRRAAGPKLSRGRQPPPGRSRYRGR
jgi:ribonuclease R